MQKKYNLDGKPINNKPIDNVNFLPQRFNLASKGAADALVKLYVCPGVPYSAYKWYYEVYEAKGYNRSTAKLLQYTSEVAAKKNITVKEYCGYTKEWLSAYTVDAPLSNNDVRAKFH